jgi:hypothetical protein
MHPPTLHETNFNRLHGVANSALHLFQQNANPNPHSADQYFQEMEKQVKGYCEKTPGTEPVLKNFNLAKTEWQLVKQGKGNHAHIVTALQAIANAHYVAPPKPAVAPPRPSTPAPTKPPNL